MVDFRHPEAAMPRWRLNLRMHTCCDFIARCGVAARCVRLASAFGGHAAWVALLCFAGLVAPTRADSMFGAIDPLGVGSKVSPAPNVPWRPADEALKVPVPGAMQTVPDEVKRPLSLAELTD